MGFFEFYISNRCVGTNISVEHQTFLIPGSRTLFRADLKDGMDVIVIAAPREEVGFDTYKQHLSIFDKGFTIRYWGSINLIFSIQDWTRHYYKLLVETEDRSGKSVYGTLEIWDDGMAKFDDKFIDMTESRRLWAKAAMLTA